MISLRFGPAVSCVALITQGVVPGLKVSTNTRVPVGIMLFDCPQTFCPRYLVL